MKALAASNWFSKFTLLLLQGKLVQHSLRKFIYITNFTKRLFLSPVGKSKLLALGVNRKI